MYILRISVFLLIEKSLQQHHLRTMSGRLLEDRSEQKLQWNFFGPFHFKQQIQAQEVTRLDFSGNQITDLAFVGCRIHMLFNAQNTKST